MGLQRVEHNSLTAHTRKGKNGLEGRKARCLVNIKLFSVDANNIEYIDLHFCLLRSSRLHFYNLLMTLGSWYN